MDCSRNQFISSYITVFMHYATVVHKTKLKLIESRIVFNVFHIPLLKLAGFHANSFDFVAIFCISC